MNRPFIDVVVPTFNRTSMLERLVQSLAAQNYPRERYRVTVVRATWNARVTALPISRSQSTELPRPSCQTV